MAALGGHEKGWQRVGVPAATYRFADLRNLTSAWECTRRGIAVLPTNPCDLGDRPADFPQIWLLASHLGLGTGDTFALGLAQGTLSCSPRCSFWRGERASRWGRCTRSCSARPP